MNAKSLRNIMEDDNDLKPLSEQDLLILARYAKVAFNLQNSNRTQLAYKLATLSWIIATYVGIFYSTSSFEVGLPFNALLVVVSICIASLLVLGSIWYLDLFVEEIKIAKTVHNGLVIEKEFSISPKIFQNVVKMNYLLGYISKKSFFYFSWAAILMLTICVSITNYLIKVGYSYWWLILAFSLSGIPLLFLLANSFIKKNDPYVILRNIDLKKELNGLRK